MRTLFTCLVLLSTLNGFAQQSLGLDLFIAHGPVPPAVQSIKTSGATDIVRAGIGLNYQQFIRNHIFLSAGLKTYELFSVYDVQGQTYDLGMESNYVSIPLGVGLVKDYGVWAAGGVIGYEYQRITSLNALRIIDAFTTSAFELKTTSFDRDLNFLSIEIFVEHDIKTNLKTVFGLSFAHSVSQVYFGKRLYPLSRIQYRIGIMLDIKKRRIKEE